MMGMQFNDLVNDLANELANVLANDLEHRQFNRSLHSSYHTAEAPPRTRDHSPGPLAIIPAPAIILHTCLEPLRR